MAVEKLDELAPRIAARLLEQGATISVCESSAGPRQREPTCPTRRVPVLHRRFRRATCRALSGSPRTTWAIAEDSELGRRATAMATRQDMAASL